MPLRVGDLREEIQMTEELARQGAEKKQSQLQMANLRYQEQPDFMPEEGIEIMVPAKKAPIVHETNEQPNDAIEILESK